MKVYNSSNPISINMMHNDQRKNDAFIEKNRFFPRIHKEKTQQLGVIPLHCNPIVYRLLSFSTLVIYKRFKNLSQGHDMNHFKYL